MHKNQLNHKMKPAISNKLSVYEKINTPNDLLKFMSNNIHYGFISRTGRKYFDGDKDWNNDWYENCIVQSGDSVLKTKCGTCWDQVELERKWFTEHKYEFKTIFIWYGIPEPNDYPTHTFLAFKKDSEWYWFENSFFKYRGIHKYNSYKELIQDVKNKHHEYTVDTCKSEPVEITSIKSYEYEKPETGLSVEDYIKYVTARIE